MRKFGWAIVALVATQSMVAAHVAPAVKDNNRYIKLTPMGNRVRLAYTVYIGEIPGQRARSTMDQNRDGELSEAESKRYGDELARAVAGSVTLEVDGRARPVAWDEVHVGLGTPVTNAGAFSVDLIEWACPSSGSSHSVVLHDRYEIDRPGETELKVDESPGVRVKQSTLGADGTPSMLDFKWLGGETPLATLGFFLRYEVDDGEAMMVSDDRCTDPTESNRRPWAYAAIAGGIAALLAVGVWALRRRRSA